MLGYYPCCIEILTLGVEDRETVSGGQFDWGGRLPKSNGGVQRFPQNGWKSLQSVKAQGSLTVRLTSRAGAKAGLSDPVVPHGRAIAQRIKATLG